MMIEPAIEVSNLTKVFHVVHREPSLKSTVVKRVLLRMLPRRTDFVALQDLSFTVQPGEAVGVIGRNGSGKSTLLSLLARIYRPTAGSITLRGHVACMLELGAGFHAEYTGVENIYLNGIILGQPRAQLQARMPQILDFAEIGEFTDTPVKHFSSGMVARLGFAVAVHTDPQILLVDEVLAVGDYQFQEKCFAKMHEFKQQGVTIFLVSHSMPSIRRVCDRVLWIEDHQLRMDGPAEAVVSAYEASQHSPQ